MLTRVLLVHDQEEWLLELASALRPHVVSVTLARSAAAACEQARLDEHDVVLVAQGLAEPSDGSLGVIDALALELDMPPPVLVLVGDEHAELRGAQLRVRDPTSILARLAVIAPRSPPTASSASRSLPPGPLLPLVASLADEGRTGTLSIKTASSQAIVCFDGGHLIDVVFGKHQGEKALARLLEASDGGARFTPGDTGVLPRHDASTRELLDRAARNIAAFAALSAQLGADLAHIYFVENNPLANDDRALASAILARVRGPTPLTQLLDDLPPPDAEILAEILALEGSGHVRRFTDIAERRSMASLDDLPRLLAAAARACAPGFCGHGRLVLAGTVSQLGATVRALLELAEAVQPDEPRPLLPIPHRVAELRFGDGVALDVIALPDVPAYASMWPLTLAGAHALVQLDGASHVLDDACRAASISVYSARSIVSGFDATRSEHVASLVRAALEARPAR